MDYILKIPRNILYHILSFIKKKLIAYKNLILSCKKLRILLINKLYIPEVFTNSRELYYKSDAICLKDYNSIHSSLANITDINYLFIKNVYTNFTYRNDLKKLVIDNNYYGTRAMTLGNVDHFIYKSFNNAPTCAINVNNVKSMVIDHNNRLYLSYANIEKLTIKKHLSICMRPYEKSLTLYDIISELSFPKLNKLKLINSKISVNIIDIDQLTIKYDSMLEGKAIINTLIIKHFTGNACDFILLGYTMKITNLTIIDETYREDIIDKIPSSNFKFYYKSR